MSIIRRLFAERGLFRCGPRSSCEVATSLQFGSGMADIEQEKRLAAAGSLDFVRDGMCLGLGSGSTAAIMLELLGERVRGGLQIRGVPTSEASRQLAQQFGIPLTDFEHVDHLDLTIDGADEVDHELNLIKGGGGALLREKIVASFSKQVVIIADSRKRVRQLGHFALPIEVVRFACKPIASRVQQLGCSVQLRRQTDGTPFETDEGNFILDCRFDQITDPRGIARVLDAMPGVMEHGLFVNLAHVLLIARGAQIDIYKR